VGVRSGERSPLSSPNQMPNSLCLRIAGCMPIWQSENAMTKYYAFLAGITLLALVSDAHAQFQEQRPADWRTFEVAEFGTRIQYPASIFTPTGKPEKGLGQRFERADGRAVLSIYSRPNEAGENPKTYLRNNLRMDRSALDYVRIARSFFAISSERDGLSEVTTPIFHISRCTKPLRGREPVAKICSPIAQMRMLDLKI
jgi:hypothetical protein